MKQFKDLVYPEKIKLSVMKFKFTGGKVTFSIVLKEGKIFSVQLSKENVLELIEYLLDEE